MTTDRPMLGMLLMLGFCVAAPFGDALAKLLAASLPILQLIAVRFAAQALLAGPALASGEARAALNGRTLVLVVLRTFLHAAGLGTMFLALTYLPLADAIAIAFVMPFIMLLLGWLVLGEQVGPRRLGACIVGFGGTLMVVQPSFAEVGAPALLPLAVAVIFALFMLATRTLSRRIGAVALQGISGVIASAVLIPMLAAGAALGLGPAPVWPQGAEWGLLVLLGVVGTGAHLLMTWSLRFAPTSTVAPMQYLEIPVAAVIGLLIFGEFPDGLALAGIGVTIAAGLYIIAREHAEGREARRARTPAPPAA